MMRASLPFRVVFFVFTSIVIVFAACLVLAIGQAGRAQTATTSRTALDYYTLQVKLDTEKHVLGGSETVVYYNNSEAPVSVIYFVLLANLGRERNPYLDRSYIDRVYWNGFDPSWTEIEGVTDAAGKPLKYELGEMPPAFQTYSLKDTLLLVHLPEPLAPGASFKLTIEFATKFPHMLTGDQAYHRDIYVWRFGWNPIALPAQMIRDGKLMSDEYFRFILPTAHYEAEIAIPEDYVLASGADEQQEIRAGTEPEGGQKRGAGAAAPGATQTASARVQPANVGPAVASAVAQKLAKLSSTKERKYKTIKLRSTVPVRSLPIAIGPARTLKRYQLSHNGLLIQVYYLPGREGAARQFATYIVEILDRYQELYGKYNYKRFVLVDSTAAGLWGMAADGFTVIGDSAFAEKDLGVPGLSDRLIEWLLAHEIAHQWFGIGIGADFNAENWISEGFAQYLSITYFEHKYGGSGPNVFVFERPGLLEKLIERELGFFNLRQHDVELPYLQVLKDKFDEPIIESLKDVRYGNWSAIRIYDKGYLVLRALARELGPERMTELIKAAYQDYDHRTLTVKELQGLAERIAGRSLDRFFHDWLYSAAQLDYGIKRVTVEEQDNGKYLNKIYLFRHGEAVLPVQLVATTKNGKKIERTWDGVKEQFVMQLETASPVVAVQLDPDEMLPDANRLNNHYPLKLRVITTGKNDLPLDAYLLRFDPATGTLEGGTLWYRWLLGRGLGAFVMYNGRGSYLRGLLDLRWIDEYNTIAGLLEWDFTRYSHPPIGSPGRYWEPRDRFALKLGREVEPTDAHAQGINYLSLNWTRTEQISQLYSTRVELTAGQPEFVRLTLSSIRPFRLGPHLYFDPSTEIGLGWNLPKPFQFTLDELHSFYQQQQEKGKAVERKQRFPGEVKFLTKLALRFPTKREMDYDLLNLALIDETDEVLFLQFGNTWPSLADLDLDIKNFKLEGGIEGITRGRTLGGLFPFTLRVGFAYPFWGGPPEERKGRIYVSFQMPLF